MRSVHTGGCPEESEQIGRYQKLAVCCKVIKTNTRSQGTRALREEDCVACTLCCQDCRESLRMQCTFFLP